MNQSSVINPRTRLRLWPGVALAALVVLARYVVPAIAPDLEILELPAPVIGVFAGLIGAAGIAIWWMFFSRAAWLERGGAVILMVIAPAAMRPFVHESIRGGHMGYMLLIYSVPVLSLALVAWAVATHTLSTSTRRVSLLAAIALACMPFLLTRTAGVSAAGSELHWRWTPTPEDRLLASSGREQQPGAPPPAPSASGAATPPPVRTTDYKPLKFALKGPAPEPSSELRRPAELGHTETAAAVEGPPEWPGFRGPNRDAVIRNVRIGTDWTASPPVPLWRRPIGPGWSSFAVDGDLLYTQEQRGDTEIVACYRLSTGDPVWQHGDPVRFWESNAGAGPRGTPAIGHGRVYAFGATGIVNALDAYSGRVLWSRNAAMDTSMDVPDWGFASSPLLIDDLVVIAASGQLVAYDAGTGDVRWMGPAGGAGYSSPHLATIHGAAQILLLRGSRTISVAPANGALLWEHRWQPGVGIVQPAVVGDGDVLITVAEAMGALGMRRVAVARGPNGWSVEERWTSRGLKPYFNDFVVHEGHAYGFDGSILACIDLADGARKWKGGRYGNGQLLLLSDQDVLLVVSEQGELALVGATSDGYRELARVPGLEGKTWNHPALIGNLLLVRNGEQMAAFRLGQ